MKSDDLINVDQLTEKEKEEINERIYALEHAVLNLVMICFTMGNRAAAREETTQHGT